MDEMTGDLTAPKDVEAHYGELDIVLRRVVNSLFSVFPTYIVVYDSKLVYECAVRTAVSLLGYNMSGDPAISGNGIQAPSHLKEAGHYAYWITKIKPLRLFNARIVSDILDKQGVSYDAAALLQLADDRRDLIVKLNELAAYSVANYIIVAAERALLAHHSQTLDAEAAERVARKHQALVTVADVRSSDIAEEVMRSLRYDNHSANAMVFLVEGLFASGLFSHKCELRQKLLAH